MADGEKKNRPEDTAFKQQRLKAWQPILTPTWVIGSFVVIGLIFIPIGVVLKTSSEDVFEQKVTYDEKDFKAKAEDGIVPGMDACNIASDGASDGDTKIGDLYNKGYKAMQADNSSNLLSKQCRLEFKFKTEAEAANANNKELFVYYELQKFYQNHRRYVKSRSDDQLRDAGKVEPGSTLETACDPQASYQVTGSDGATISDYYYWPCGLIANSVFNDGLFYRPGGDQKEPWVQEDIAWSSDMSKKFANPTINYDTWQYNWQTYSQMGCYTDASLAEAPVDPTLWNRTKCKTWGESCTSGGTNYNATASSETVFSGNCCECLAGSTLVSEGGIPPPSENKEKGGLKDEHFVVWMRTAGLPTFRKLYAKIPAQEWKKGDTFQIIVVPNFVVSTFDGTKSIVVSTTSWLGGKNSVLGVAYIVVGSICWVLALAFALKQYFSPRKLGDTKYLVWKNRA